MVKVTTDWHIGVKRVGGTTQQSQIELRNWQLQQLALQLDDNDHLIAGDLFDEFTIDAGQILATYEVFARWLQTYRRKLILVRGNHDWKPNAGATSSFDLLCNILTLHFPDRVKVITEATEYEQFYLIPHVPNNDILELEIEKAYSVKDKVVVFHANFDNGFAAVTDHSLNVSSDQVNRLLDNGNTILFGHDHVHRVLHRGRLVILGCAAPTSVSDCLGSGRKFAAYFDGLKYELSEIWSGGFAEMSWTDEAIPDCQFLRVTGTANAEQASSVVNVVSNIRRESQAFVVSNAVKVDGIPEFDLLQTLSADEIEKVDVLQMLFDELDPVEVTKLKAIL